MNSFSTKRVNVLPPAGRIQRWRRWRSHTSSPPPSAAWLAWPEVSSAAADIIQKVPRTSCPCLWEPCPASTPMTLANAWWAKCEFLRQLALVFCVLHRILVLFLDHLPVHCYFHYFSAFGGLFVSPPWEERLDRGGTAEMSHHYLVKNKSCLMLNSSVQMERELCSASAEFEDFVLQFMDRWVTNQMLSSMQQTIVVTYARFRVRL